MVGDGSPELLSSARFRGNGIHMSEVVLEKKGRILNPDGTRGFGVVSSKVLKKEERMLSPRTKIEGPPAVVSVGRGLTLNLGDFQSARVDEWISMPCAPTAQDVEATRNDLTREVEAHVEAQRVRIKGSVAEKAVCVKSGLLSLTDFDAAERAMIEPLLK